MIQELELNWTEPGRALTHAVIARKLRVEGDVAAAESIRTRCGLKVGVMEPGTINRAEVDCVPCLEADWLDGLTVDLQAPSDVEPAPAPA